MHESSYRSAVLSSALGADMLNARAWISVEVSRDIDLHLDDVSFITGFDRIPAYGGRLVDAADLYAIPFASYQVFEPLRSPGKRTLRLREAHSRVALYTWGDPDYALPAGSRRATLIDDDRLLQLHSGDVLIFEEVLGADSGMAADADPERRHVVRLIRVETITDGCNGGRELLAIEWHADDALPFSMQVSRHARAPGAAPLGDITVVRANVVLVDHGRTVKEALTVDDGGRPDATARLTVSRSPLTVADPLPARASACAAFERDARLARAQVSGIAIAADHDDDTPVTTLWKTCGDLEACRPSERRFAVRTGRDGRAQLLFGDGEHGARLLPGTIFITRYRIGQSAAGNVDRDRIAYLVLRNRRLADVVVVPRNPLPARGGGCGAILPDPLARRRTVQGERGYGAEELAAEALRHPRVRHAAAWFCNDDGSDVVHLVTDTRDGDVSARTVRQEVQALLAPYLPARHTLRVAAARRVPIALALRVQLQDDARQDEVRRRLLDLFVGREGPAARLAFFHPERRRLGQPVYAWSIASIAASAPGVGGVEIVRLVRLDEAEDGAEWGVVRIGPGEIAALDNDPLHPTRGTLEIDFV